MDRFIQFVTLPIEAQDFLAKYESPNSEESTWKSIPIEYLDVVRTWLKPAGRFTVRFRGPRYDFTRGFTLKSAAEAFSVYER